MSVLRWFSPCLPALVGCLALTPGMAAAAQPQALPDAEWALWQRHLLPLPQQVSADGKWIIPAGQIRVTPAADGGEIGDQAAGELRQLIGDAPPGSFEIRLQLADDPRLADLPNRPQAYLIEPSGEDALLLTAAEPRGLYYAAQTLKSLLAARRQGDTFEIPRLTVVDYPDFDERGVWNIRDHEQVIPWLASLKLNFSKMHETELLPIEKGKPGRVKIPVDLMLSARRMAFNLCPTITHVNFAGTDTGLFRAYPETAGRGEGALAGLYFAHQSGGYRVGDLARVPNASHPTFIKYVTDWVRDIARQGGLDISCWLSERPATDGRPETLAVGQFVLEARAFIAAWETVRKEYPGLQIRLFISTTTNERYEQILAEAPPEVKIERCCSQDLERIPFEPRDLTRSPMLEAHARNGRWIATYDVPVGAFVQVETPDMKLPMRSPQMVRHFVRQYYDQGYKAAYSMMMLTWGHYQEKICDLNIAAAAEYEWNIDGRGERDFAIAFATRAGLPDPEAVGDWIDLMGPIEFDVYGSSMPMAISRGWAAEMVRDRKMPVLGSGIFRYYRTPEDFDRKIADCDKALAIAARIDPNYANETQITKSYVQIMRDVYRLAAFTATHTLETPEDQAAVSDMLVELRAHGDANIAAIRAWRSHLGPEPESEWEAERIDRDMRYTQQTVDGIANYLAARYSYLVER